mmetsp:Transcript_10850/g.13392  ORF Transcript_10850/g.13392 Transcript_10850/m.13392 type:complete len:87 (+) Transcript_10850:2-262(+)
MTYPLIDADKNSNESFTDSREVSYDMQNQYVLRSWSRYDISPVALQERQSLQKLANNLQDIFVYKQFENPSALDELEKQIRLCQHM